MVAQPNGLGKGQNLILPHRGVVPAPWWPHSPRDRPAARGTAAEYLSIFLMGNSNRLKTNPCVLRWPRTQGPRRGWAMPPAARASRETG